MWITDFVDSYRQEIKIFVFFLLVFTSFAHWIGTAEDANLALTQAIAEQGSLEISDYIQNNKDVIEVEGKIYNTKSPLSSIIAVPGHFIAELFTGAINVESQELLRFMAVFLSSAIPGSLLLVLIYRTLGDYTAKTSERTLITFLIGTGTLVFAYSTTFFGTITATFFVYLSYYLVRNNRNPRRLIAGGIAAGLGLSSSQVALVVISGIGLYLYLREKDFSISKPATLLPRSGSDFYLPLGYFSGILIGLLPLFIYNQIITGNPLIPPMWVFGQESGSKSLFRFMPTYLFLKSIRVYFAPHRGIFFWSPLLLLAFTGLYRFYREEKIRAIFVGSLIVLFTAFIVPYFWWSGGSSFGLRYSTLIVPFLATPLYFAYKSMKPHNYVRKVFYIISALSIGITSLSISNWIHPFSYGEEIFSKYWDLETITEILANPLYNHNLPQVMKNGFPSPILNHITGIEGLNMYFRTEIDRTIVLGGIENGLVLFNSKFAWISLFGILGLLVFRKELKEQISGLYWKMLISGFLVLFLTSFGLGNIHFDGWHMENPQEEVQWSQDQPRITFHSDSNSPRLLIVKGKTFRSERKISFRLNGEKIGESRFSPNKNSFLAEINPEKGANTLEFDITGECKVIGEYINNSDRRCVKLGLESFEVASPSRGLLYPDENFDVHPEKIVLDKNATSYIKLDEPYSLKFNARAINGVSDLDLFIGGREVLSVKEDGFGHQVSTPYLNETGLTRIRIETDCPEKCDVVELRDFEIKKWQNQPETLLYELGEGWYNSVGTENYTWSNTNSSIYIYNYQNKSINRTLWVSGRSFNSSRNITYILNGKKIGARTVRPTVFKIMNIDGERVHGENKYGFKVRLEPRENILRIKSDEECTSFSEVNNNNDKRCGIYGFRRLYLTGQ